MNKVEYLKSLRKNAGVELDKVNWEEAFFNYLTAEGLFKVVEYSLLRADKKELQQLQKELERCGKNDYEPTVSVKLYTEHRFYESFSKYIFSKYHVTAENKILYSYLKNMLNKIGMDLIEDNLIMYLQVEI